MACELDLRMKILVREWLTGDLITPQGTHELDFSGVRPSGSSAGRVQVAWSDSRSVTNGVPDTIDLRGGTTGAFGQAAQAFAVVTHVFVRNKSTVSGRNLTVGGGSNPFITWLAASGDAVVVGPDGFVAVASPLDGYATTAGSADILTITSSAGTIDYDILIIGR